MFRNFSKHTQTHSLSLSRFLSHTHIMGISSFNRTSFIFLVVGLMTMVTGQPLVPALLLFGDSVVDVGNNNYIKTIVKSDFPPYGRDFVAHEPTGRFCNGKLASDFTGT